jgi:hypothetical protein
MALTALGGTSGGAMSTSTTGVPPTKPISDDEIRSLLDHYRCPVPFHVVRTRLLGNIASPDMTASPMDTVAGLWGGELPAIDNLDALNELLRVLLMGLWNRLARHQNRNAPFRMIRVDAPETREGLANIAAVRREEVVGFIEGMLGRNRASRSRSGLVAHLRRLRRRAAYCAEFPRLRVIRQSLRRLAISRRLGITSAS